MSEQCLIKPTTTVADILSKAPAGAKIHLEIRGRNTRSFTVECSLCDGLVLRDAMNSLVIVPFSSIDTFSMKT